MRAGPIAGGTLILESGLLAQRGRADSRDIRDSEQGQGTAQVPAP